MLALVSGIIANQTGDVSAFAPAYEIAAATQRAANLAAASNAFLLWGGVCIIVNIALAANVDQQSARR